MLELNKLRLGAATLLASNILGGCSFLQDQYAVDVAVSEDTNKRRQTLPGNMPTFDLRADCMPADLVDRRCDTPTMAKHFANSNGSASPLWRDRFQDYLLWRSDQQCERHKASILANQSTGNFALSTVTTGTSAIAAIVVAPAAGILSAIAAISSGTKSAFNEDFYRQFVGPAIIRRINADRSDMYAVIMARRGLPIEKTTARTVTERAPAAGSTVESRATERDNAAKAVATTAEAETAYKEAAKTAATKEADAKAAAAKLDAEKDEEKKKPLKVDAENAAAASKTAQETAKIAKSTADLAKEAEKNARSKVEAQYVTRTYTVPEETRYEVDYQASRRTAPFSSYTIEAAIQDVERYHQMCSFVSGLASLIQPGEKFADTELGIRQRIANLTAQLERNNETAKSLGITSIASKNLLQINDDISRQIMVLQQRLATAPMSIKTE